MKSMISTAIAVAAGILVLAGYFIPVPILQTIRGLMVQWAISLAAFALLVGVINLLRVHFSKVRQGKIGAVYSLILLLSFFVTVIIVGFLGPVAGPSMWIFNNIQLPIESSLMALLSIILIVAVVRLFQRRLNLFSVVFVLTVLMVLLSSAPIFFIGDVPILTSVRSAILQVLAVGGARGILLGVALGVIATGARVIMMADRPYSG